VRRLRALLLGTGVTAIVILGPATMSSADAPAQTGWWTQTNPGSIEGSPTLPAPPDVKGRDLLVEGGPQSTSGTGDTGAIAYAALIYQVPDGASVGRLKLTVVPDTASVPITTLELCPLTSPAFFSQYGGPSSGAPSFGCSHNVTASASSSGNTYQFSVAPLVAGGALAVAVLPTSPTDRVVLGPPDDQSLSVTAGSAGAGGQTATGSNASGFTGAGSDEQGISGGATVSVPPAESLQTPNISDSAVPAPSSSSTPTGARSALGSQFAVTASKDDRAAPLAVALLLAAVCVGGALWLAVGRAAVRRSAASDA